MHILATTTQKRPFWPKPHILTKTAHFAKKNHFVKKPTFWQKSNIWTKIAHFAKLNIERFEFMWSPSVTGHGLHQHGLKLTKFDSTPTPTKSNEGKSKSNEAQPSWTWTWPNWTWPEIAQGEPILTLVESTQGHRVQVQRGGAELDLDLDEMALSWSCNSSAMLTRREASTSRRSRGALVLPTRLRKCTGLWFWGLLCYLC